MEEERPTFDLLIKYKGKEVLTGESSQGTSQQEIQGVGKLAPKTIRKVEKGKEKISDFANITTEEIDTSVPPPSPPHDVFREDEVAEVLVDLDRAIIPSVIP